MKKIYDWKKSYRTCRWLFFVMCLAFGQLLSAQVFRTADVKINSRSFGAGVGLTVNLFDKVDFAPSLNYYKKNNNQFLGGDADFHYLFQPASHWEVFPIAGLTVIGDRVMEEHHDRWQRQNKYRLGADVGAGASFEIDKKWVLKWELKYQSVTHYDALFCTVGLSYKF